MRVGLKTHAARQQAPGDEKQRTEGHHAAGQHRGVDLHRAAPAHAHDVTAVGDDRDGRRNDSQRRVAVREIDVAQRQQHRADDRHADRREGPHRTAFAEETHHHDGHDQRIHEVNRRGHPAGDVLIGDHQAQRRRGAEQAQQEHRAQLAPPEAEIAPRQQAVSSQTQRRHTPAVGQDLERRITHAQQQQGEQRGQSECRRGESRPENAFDTQHKKLVWSRKNKKYIAIPHSPGVKSAAAEQFSPFPGRGSGIRRRDRPELPAARPTVAGPASAPQSTTAAFPPQASGPSAGPASAPGSAISAESLARAEFNATFAV